MAKTFKYQKRSNPRSQVSRICMVCDTRRAWKVIWDKRNEDATAGMAVSISVFAGNTSRASWIAGYLGKEPAPKLLIS